MALGQNIYEGSGRLLFEKHMLLSEEHISNLEFMGFPGVYVDDEFTQGVEIQQVLTPEVRGQALKVVHEFFCLNCQLSEPSALEIKLEKTIEHVLEDVLSNGDVMLNVLDIKNYNDYIYYHSVNVAMLSAVIGVHCGLEHNDLKELVVAALLHDIGKKVYEQQNAGLSAEQKERDRADWEKHPKMGADFLKKHFDFPAIVVSGVLHHHEAYNGTGYPEKMAGEEIPLYARIIHIADGYDVLTTKRPQRGALSPSDALEYLMSRVGQEFDPNLLEVFIGKVALYPVGCEVRLSNGMHGVVTRNFERFPLRPMVKVIETGKLLNLCDDPANLNITIVQLLI